MLDSILSHTNGTLVLDFLKNHRQEYTAKEIAQNITNPFTSRQVAGAIRNMYFFEKRFININKSQHPFKYSYNDIVTI